MSGAIFMLAVHLIAGPSPDREYSGTTEIPASETTATPPVSGEVLPVPAPAAAPPPAAESTTAPAQAPSLPVSPRPDARPTKATPKWWGPFPRPKITGFGGPVAHLTGLDRKFAMMVGLAGGLTIRQRVSIGAMVLWLLNPSDAGTTALGAKQRLNTNYGGLLLDVALVRRDRLDLSLAGLIGGGGACLQDPEKGSCYSRTAFFFGQPSLGVHIRLLPVLRLVFMMGYRLVAAREWAGPTGRQLGAPVGTVMLELGWF